MLLGCLGDVHAVRQAALRRYAEAHGYVLRCAAEPDELLAEVDVLFVGRPSGWPPRVAEAARHGVHVFVDGAPAASLPEGEAMIRLAEEAGVEVGVSRPLRFVPALQGLPARAHLVVLRQTLPPTTPPRWPRHLADAVDLCCTLAASQSVQRIDAEAVRDDAPWPEALAFALRFHNGAYAQVHLLRPTGTEPPATGSGEVFVGGSGFRQTALLPPAGPPPAALVQAETAAFLDALAAGRPAPVSALDGLQTMRLVERLLARLR